MIVIITMTTPAQYKTLCFSSTLAVIPRGQRQGTTEILRASAERPVKRWRAPVGVGQIAFGSSAAVLRSSAGRRTRTTSAVLCFRQVDGLD
jgi:hypothetical protein